MRQIGLWNLDNIGPMLDSHGIWPFTHVLGWTKEQVESVTTQAKAELRDPRLRLYIPLLVRPSPMTDTR